MPAAREKAKQCENCVKKNRTAEKPYSLFALEGN